MVVLGTSFLAWSPAKLQHFPFWDLRQKKAFSRRLFLTTEDFFPPSKFEFISSRKQALLQAQMRNFLVLVISLCFSCGDIHGNVQPHGRSARIPQRRDPFLSAQYDPNPRTRILQLVRGVRFRPLFFFLQATKQGLI